MVTLRSRVITVDVPLQSQHRINEDVDNTDGALRYEKFRDQRIKENLQRMEKLGISNLSLKLKAEFQSPKRIVKSSQKRSLLQIIVYLQDDPQGWIYDLRLKNASPVIYAETQPKKRKEPSKKIVIVDGAKPEIYTEEHVKLLGTYEETWTLFVDGVGSNGKRIYDPVDGKTCHQCRQKTLGHRTCCNNCKLLQGQFCGDCLFMRYGENVLEANKKPDWICPVCRGICNCSFCRIKRGWAPTGPLYRKVLGLGFNSVAHYLIQTRQANQETEKTFSSKRPLLFTDVEDASSKKKDSHSDDKYLEMASPVNNDNHESINPDKGYINLKKLKYLII